MGKMNYKISSRATILLGRESVSKVDGAIIELIKNTYDADATFCVVYFDVEKDRILILDNGCGMTEEIIQNNWMMIGTDNKKEEFRSIKNRIKSGEKGIGRFALDRLGSKCIMYTKHEESMLIKWETDWTNFEVAGKNLEDIEADFDFVNSSFEEIVPKEIVTDINRVASELLEEEISKVIFYEDYLRTGTLFIIEELRDKWTNRSIKKVLDAMGYLIPPTEQKDYLLLFKKDSTEPMSLVDNEVSDEFDYKIKAEFDGEKFVIELVRNEFDLERIPDEVFDMDRFEMEPFRKIDFEKKTLKFDLPISQLMSNAEDSYIKVIKQIGTFKFDYTFMKMTIQEDSNETFYYKEISKNRRLWLDQNSGIKIYRDNFLVRPYGDAYSDSFDWLGLDARKVKNSDSISHKSGRWKVRNRQGQGTIYISRVENESILDKSSREGVIENEYFRALKDVILAIISIFERDRSYIGYTMRLYSDKVGEKEKIKEAGKNIADGVLDKRQKKNISKKAVERQANTLAKAVKIYEEEREELISEIKLLRSLATNGLITTSIVHDLKGINAMLVNRVDSLNSAIEKKKTELVKRNINDLRKNDIFLKSWISVLTNQIKSDKRKRIKKDVYATIKDSIQVLEPILFQKKIEIDFQCDEKLVYKKIFISDFESIMYNLIINSIESFEKSKIDKRVIKIALETNDEFIMYYNDNGKGLDALFSNPYDIFNFGTTSKFDINGEQTGTGLGMYIIASTLSEYNAAYKITEQIKGFGLKVQIPL